MKKLRKFLSCKKGVISMYGVVVALIACIMLCGYLDLTQTTHVVEEIQSIMDITALSTLQGSLDAEGVRFDRMTIRGYQYFQITDGSGLSTAEKHAVTADTDKDMLLELLAADNSLADTTVWLDGTNADKVDNDKVREIVLENFNYYLQKILFSGDELNHDPLFNYSGSNIGSEQDYNSQSIIKRYEIREFDAGLLYSSWGVDSTDAEGNYHKIPQAYLDTTVILYLDVEPTFSSLNLGIEQSQVYNALTSANSTSDLHVEGYSADGLLVVSIRTLARMTVQGFIASDDTPDSSDVSMSIDSIPYTDETYFDITDAGVVTGFSDIYYALPFEERPKNIKMPETIRGITPTSIAANAFARAEDKIVVMVLPATIATIGDRAFATADSLRGIAFMGSSRLRALGVEVFQGCTSLTSFKMPGSLVAIPDGTFENCVNLSSITFSSNLTTIGARAFKNCTRLKGTIELPLRVAEIGTEAFYGCSSVRSVRIPPSLASLGENAFARMTTLLSFTQVGYPINFEVSEGVLYQKEADGTYALIQYPIAKQALTYTIPLIKGKLVTRIGSYAFYGNQHLQELLYTTDNASDDKTILSGIQVVGDNAFERCTALKQLKFADDKTDAAGNVVRKGLISIGSQAFLNTSKLQLVYIDKTKDSVIGSPWGASIGVTTIKWKDNFDIDWSMIFTYTEDGVILGLTDYGADQVDAGLSLIIPQKIADPYWGDITITAIGDNAFSCEMSQSMHAATNKKIQTISIVAAIKSIGKNAFNGTKIAEFTLPTSVTSIGDYAFANSAISTFIINGNTSLTLGNGVFAYTALTNFTLPATVTSIGTNLFEGCSELSTVRINAQLTGIPDYMFKGCGKLNNIVIPDTVTTIGNYAFDGCSILSGINVVNITKVGQYAFANCTTLGQLYFGTAIVEIGARAFYNTTNLSEIRLDVDEDSVPGQPWGAASYTNIIWKNSEWTRYFVYEASGEKWKIVGLSEVGRQALLNGTLTKLETPSLKDEKEIISIEFSDADRTALAKLKSMIINIAADVEFEIKDNAFKGCTSLTDIVLPRGVISIGANAFKGCTALKTLYIPADCTSLGNNAFDGCVSLTSVQLGSDLKVIGAYAFYNCSNMSTLIINGDVTTIGSYAFSGCSKLTTFTLNPNLSSIGEYAFSECTSLKTIVNNNSNKINSIAFGLFKNCTSLEDIAIPDSVTRIGSQAFRGCTALKNITIPDNVTIIDSHAFMDCSNLTTINISDTSKLKDIAERAFQACYSLGTIRLPNQIVRVGDEAFINTSSLTDIYVARPKYNAIQTNAARVENVPNSPWGATGARIHWANTLTIAETSYSISITLNADGSSEPAYVMYTYDGDISDITISSNDPSIANVTWEGDKIKVTGVRSGSTRIQVSDGTTNSNIVVTVGNSMDALSNMTINPTKNSSGIQNNTGTRQVEYSGSMTTLSVTSDDTSIATATIDNTGKITVTAGTKSGSTVIRVTDGGMERTFTVTVNQSIASISAVTMNPIVNSSGTISNTTTNIDIFYTGNSDDLTVSSSNTNIVSVTRTGSTIKLTAGKTGGTATITVNGDNCSKTFNVTVNQAFYAISNQTLNPEWDTRGKAYGGIDAIKTLTLYYTGNIADVTVSVSDTSIVTVSRPSDNQLRLVSGGKAGTATVTVKGSNNCKMTFNVTVNHKLEFASGARFVANYNQNNVMIVYYTGDLETVDITPSVGGSACSIKNVDFGVPADSSSDECWYEVTYSTTVDAVIDFTYGSTTKSAYIDTLVVPDSGGMGWIVTTDGVLSIPRFELDAATTINLDLLNHFDWYGPNPPSGSANSFTFTMESAGMLGYTLSGSNLSLTKSGTYVIRVTSNQGTSDTLTIMVE